MLDVNASAPGKREISQIVPQGVLAAVEIVEVAAAAATEGEITTNGVL
jgi:hypothetical protein